MKGPSTYDNNYTKNYDDNTTDNNTSYDYDIISCDYTNIDSANHYTIYPSNNI